MSRLSVAHSLASAKGIEGKKGVLWWQIREILLAKQPPFCIFENVDRLLKSPAKQRGRDFGVMLSCLNELGYSVEWRVVNAATYGGAQRRRRVFIFAFHQSTKYSQSVSTNIQELFLSQGFMAKAFPISNIYSTRETTLDNDVIKVSDNFAFDFAPAGFMQNGHIFTTKVEEVPETPICLGDLLESTDNNKYYIEDEERLAKWVYQKGSKKILRQAANGHEYMYSEGPVAFPDSWHKPARTMLTSESTLNRSSHVVIDPHTNKLRILTPVEAERLQGFDDNWTNTGMSERMRYFCMGNALVVPMVTRMAHILDAIVEAEA